MKKCPFCKADIEDNARFCLYCMSSLNQKEIVTACKRKKPQWSMIIVAIVAVFLMLAIILPETQSEDPTPSENQQLQSAPSSKPTESSVTTAPSGQPVTHPSSQTASPETQPAQVTTQPTKPTQSTLPSTQPTQTTQTVTQPSTQPTSQPTQPATQPTTVPVTSPTEPTEPEEPPTDPTEPPHAHSYTQQNTELRYQKTSATCTAAAVYYYSCQCGAQGNETFSYGDVEHSVKTVPARPATCTNSGMTEHSYCIRCGTQIVAPQIIPYTGHTWGEVDSYAACVTCGRFPNGEPEEIILRFPEFPVEQNNKFRILSCTYTFDSGPPQQNKMEVTLTVKVMNISSVRLYEGIDVTLSEFGRGCSSMADIRPGQSSVLTVVFTDIPAGIYDVVFQ